MKVYRLDCAMLVRRPLAEVFALFENPQNLIRINPEPMSMRQGAETTSRIRWAGKLAASEAGVAKPTKWANPTQQLAAFEGRGN